MHRRALLAAARVRPGQDMQSLDQMILPSLLALDADHRAIGGLNGGVAVQRHPDRKTRLRVVANDLNAGNCLAPWPQTNRLDAFPASTLRSLTLNLARPAHAILIERLGRNLTARIAAAVNERKIATPANGEWHAATVIRVQKRLANG